jgi:hypothetical protein
MKTTETINKAVEQAQLVTATGDGDTDTKLRNGQMIFVVQEVVQMKTGHDKEQREKKIVGK